MKQQDLDRDKFQWTVCHRALENQHLFDFAHTQRKQDREQQHFKALS
jgi:hypothetical protein